MMKPRSRIRRIDGASAFSLPEVTISMGIVAVLMLPALAMLAGGGSMQSLARDREAASRLARELTTMIGPREDGTGFEIPLSRTELLTIDLPEGGAPTAIHAAFDREGIFLRTVSETEFLSGIRPAGDPLHAVRLSLSATNNRPGLLDLDLSVQCPATAADSARSKETFQTRLAIP